MDLFESGGVGWGGGGLNSGFTVFTFPSGSTGLKKPCSVVQDHRDRVLTVTAAHLGCFKCTEGVGRAVYSGSGREARKLF